MDNKKQLTKQAVKLALDLLIASNGQATTLEIKQHLRELNFEARQEDVHNFMEEIFTENQNQYQRQLNTDTSNHYQVYTAVTDWEQTVHNTPSAQSSSVSDNSNQSDSQEISSTKTFAPALNDKKSFDQVVAEIEKRTPMHNFQHHVRESTMVPGVKIIADYDPRSGRLRTHNDIEAAMAKPGTDVLDATQSTAAQSSGKRTVDPIREPVKIFYTDDQFKTWRDQQGDNFDGDHWVTHQRDNENTEFHVYNKAVSRDQARSRHASLHGIKSGEIRCSLVKNFLKD
jgi:hypothetical protein